LSIAWYQQSSRYCAKLGHNAGEMNRISALLFFSICAVVDFAFGCIKWHSVFAGVVATVCGLPLTVLLFLFFRGRSSDESPG